jgi:GNAT superfamily N-acetyltransferase
VECPDLASELVRLAREDLAIRQRLAETGELSDGYHPEMRAVHRRNGDRLTEVLDQVGCWPGHHLVGRDGSSAGFLVAQHDVANPALMRLSRELYAAAVEQGGADPAKLAQLEDRIRYFEGRHQWCGTHWGCEQWARERWADGLVLAVFQDNRGARRLYERHGFRDDVVRVVRPLAPE